MLRRAPLKRSAPMKRTPMKKRAPKKRAGQDKRYLEACRGEPCWLKLPGIRCAPMDTVVPAHRNEGKGMGLKVSDVFTVPACHTCHAAYDQGGMFTREQKRALWNDAYTRWAPVRARKLNLKEERK